MKRVLLAVLVLALSLIVALVINTYRQSSRQLEAAPAPALTVDSDALAESLAGAIRLRTVSSKDDPS